MLTKIKLFQVQRAQYYLPSLKQNLSIEKILKRLYPGSQVDDDDERILYCQLLSTIRAVENVFRMSQELQISQTENLHQNILLDKPILTTCISHNFYQGTNHFYPS
jgi:hypothetical protein